MARIVPKLNLNKTPQLVENNSLVFAKNIRLLKDGTIGPDTSLEEIETVTGNLIPDAIYHPEVVENLPTPTFSILDVDAAIRIAKNIPLPDRDITNHCFDFDDSTYNTTNVDYSQSDSQFYTFKPTANTIQLRVHNHSAIQNGITVNYTCNAEYGALFSSQTNLLGMAILSKYYDDYDNLGEPYSYPEEVGLIALVDVPKEFLNEDVVY